MTTKQRKPQTSSSLTLTVWEAQEVFVFGISARNSVATRPASHHVARRVAGARTSWTIEMNAMEISFFFAGYAR